MSAVQPEELTIYQPERLGIWVSGDTHRRPANLRWPLIAPKPTDLSIRRTVYEPISRPSLILEGEPAIRIFQLFDQSVSGAGEEVEEEGVFYHVLARPLLPGEFSTKPVAKPDLLHCRSADGELKIPRSTPTLVVVPTDIPRYKSLRRVTPTQTATPTRWPTYTPGPTLTSTPIPVLSAHGWFPKERLVVFNAQEGDGNCAAAFTPPKLTLYGDGQLFYLQHTRGMQLMTARLSERQVCQWMNAIDRTGFFDYNPATYNGDLIESRWASYYLIEVNAWRSKSVSLNNLGSAIYNMEHPQDECKNPPYCNIQFPTILPALRNTYHLLTDYKPVDGRVYQPGRVGIWVTPYLTTEEYPLWPESFPRLAGLAIPAPDWEEIKPPQLIVEGELAREVFDFFHQLLPGGGQIVLDGGESYRISARPLLPDEFTARSTIVRKPISCQPADGVIDIVPERDE